jgi:hypothetical protein
MPPANIVLGTLPQLEHALADAIARAKDGDPLAPVSVLVDNSLLKQQLPRRLALRGQPHLNVRYFRPDELARHVASAKDEAVLPRLTRDAERFLIRDIAAGAGGYFAGVAGREGFADALGRAFGDLEMGGFTPHSFAAACGGVPDDDAGKLAQLAKLYAAYAAQRERFATRAEAYAAARKARLDGPLLVYGVWSPADVQAALIEHIASYGQVTVFLPHSNSGADDAHAAFRQRLIDGGATVDRIDRVSGFIDPLPAVPTLLPLAAEPRVISAPDTVREVWEAARWCLDLARQGVKFHEMAVVYRNRDPYRALIDEIFSEAEIETYLHDGRLLAQHPLGRRLIALLDLAATHEQFQRAKVMEFLTETELPRETRLRYEDRERRIFARPSEWEMYTRDAGVVEGAAQWQSRLQRLAQEKRDGARTEGREWLAEVADRIDTFARFAADLHARLAERPTEATWEEHLADPAGARRPGADPSRAGARYIRRVPPRGARGSGSA